jgi:hypothetical protein
MKESGCYLIGTLSQHLPKGSEETHAESTVRLAVLRNEIGNQYLPSRKQGCSPQSAQNDCRKRGEWVLLIRLSQTVSEITERTPIKFHVRI